MPKKKTPAAKPMLNQDKAKELGLPEDIGAAVIHLAERLIALEKNLAALQKGVAHITGIKPIADPLKG